MAQLVRGDTPRQLRLAAFGQQLVGALDHRADDTLASVVLVARRAPGGREDEVGGVRPVGRQLVVQRGDDVDDPLAGLGFRPADGDLARGELDVAPAQRRCLADTQPGEDEDGDEATASGRACRGRPVQPRRRVEQRLDLLGAVEPDRELARCLELAVAGVDADRVAGDQLPLFGHGEDLPQARDRLVDRFGGQQAFADLVLAVAVDLGDGDLRRVMGVEERQQVTGELPPVVRERRLAQLAAAGVEPLRGELVEGRRHRRPRDAGRGRDPDAALDVGQDVAQLGLGFLARPAIGGGAASSRAFRVNLDEARSELCLAVVLASRI